MRRARRGTRYAVVGFGLVVVVVLGGMTWATLSTLSLAEIDIVNQLSFALERMDGYLSPILTTEAGRPYTDYLAVHTPPLRTSEGHRLHPSEYEDFGLASPLTLTEPRHDWMELYFQMDQDGVWSSPQIPDEPGLWEDAPHTNAVSARRLRNAFRWLQTTLTPARLDDVASRALECHCPLRGQPGHENCDCLCAFRQARRDGDETGRDVLLKEYQRRLGSLASRHLKHLPSALCLPRDVVAGSVRRYAPGEFSASDDPGAQPISVEASQAPMAAFWLKGENGGGLKLAFLRIWYVGPERCYQGFVGDWNRLKPELLARINDLFPNADLEPVLSDQDLDADTQAMAMGTLTARLVVPSLVGGPRAAAWRSVRRILASTWAAAVAILVAAGWGIRNLIALTERRMQFAYAVTHELRTPLTTFRLYADMLSEGLVPDTARQEYLDTLNRESIRLSSLVQGILEYARLENQKIQLNPIETDGSSLADLVRENLEERCREYGTEARTSNEIPAGTPLCTDVDLVNRIAGVLVSNACRHARTAEHPTVAMHLAGRNGKVYLDVIDSGAGVDRSDARTIFRPFRRGKGADAAAQGGIGLGLALARSWAKLLGGRLDLVARHDPEYGGARFRLTIPTRLP